MIFFSFPFTSKLQYSILDNTIKSRKTNTCFESSSAILYSTPLVISLALQIR